MKLILKNLFPLLSAAIILLGYAMLAGCTHDDNVIKGSGANIVRGNEKLTLTDPKVSFDKSHSNIGWESVYLGTTALLTGRFNNFGFTSFNFDESNANGINFEAWVWLNTVNTSEPGRDQGCLLGTYGTALGKTTETENLAIIKSKFVELSLTDKSYFVKADLTFHGVTKEVTAKLSFDGKGQTVRNGVTQNVYGFSLSFQFLAKTDFLISSTNIADNVKVSSNAIFRQSL
ncbi:MAG: YceI family protein [Chitinophagaceae bacterium]|nr:YceI family protein [Chitinophagaceae bacterium]